MKFWIGAIDNLGSKCIIKMFLFFLYVCYERRYCDAKFESGNLLLRNVVVIIIINLIVARSCVVRLQFLTQDALAFTSEYMHISYIARSRDNFWWMSEGENEIAPFPIRYISTRTSIDVRLLESTLIYYTLFSVCRRETNWNIRYWKNIRHWNIFRKLPF